VNGFSNFTVSANEFHRIKGKNDEVRTIIIITFFLNLIIRDFETKNITNAAIQGTVVVTFVNEAKIKTTSANIKFTEKLEFVFLCNINKYTPHKVSATDNQSIRTAEPHSKENDVSRNIGIEIRATDLPFVCRRIRNNKIEDSKKKSVAVIRPDIASSRERYLVGNEAII
jgi:hypothetical protein